MRKCLKCLLDGDEASFYPDPKQTWCKLCVQSQVLSRTSKDRSRSEKIGREQRSVLAVIEGFQKNQQFVYLLEASGRYKIGFSSNINKRVAAFNTANSVPCKIIAVAPGGRQLEKELHQRFNLLRINREWFKKSSVILGEFAKLTDSKVFLFGYLSSGKSQSSDTGSTVKIVSQPAAD